MSLASEWERLVEALKRLWMVLVEKGYAGWIVWAARQAGAPV
jgi:hypothetical protein